MATESVHPSGGVWISAAILVFFLVMRLLRMARTSGQTRTLKLEALWMAPLLYLGLAALVIATQPPKGLEWLWLAAGAAAGGPLGWWRGKTVEIMVHRGTGTLTARTSSAAGLFVIGLMALRYGLRYLLRGEAGALHLTVNIITAMFMAFALGLVVMQRVEMTLRAMRLLAASASAPMAPEPADRGAAAVSADAPPATAAATARLGLSNAQLAMVAAAVFALIVIVGLALPR